MVLKCICKSDAHHPPDILSDGDLAGIKLGVAPQASQSRFPTALHVRRWETVRLLIKVHTLKVELASITTV
jgi:hypothetical protein